MLLSEQGILCSEPLAEIAQLDLLKRAANLFRWSLDLDKLDRLATTALNFWDLWLFLVGLTGRS